VVYHPRHFRDATTASNSARTSYEAKLYSVMLEVLKINDRFYHAFETDQKGGTLFRRFFEAGEMIPWDGFPLPPDETVIPETGVLSTSPLPILEEEEISEDDYSDDDGLPVFESFEEAGRFFSKMPWNNWTW
jgi:hypothetical protein